MASFVRSCSIRCDQSTSSCSSSTSSSTSDSCCCSTSLPCSCSASVSCCPSPCAVALPPRPCSTCTIRLHNVVAVVLVRSIRAGLLPSPADAGCRGRGANSVEEGSSVHARSPRCSWPTRTYARKRPIATVGLPFPLRHARPCGPVAAALANLKPAIAGRSAPRFAAGIVSSILFALFAIGPPGAGARILPVVILALAQVCCRWRWHCRAAHLEVGVEAKAVRPLKVGVNADAVRRPLSLSWLRRPRHSFFTLAFVSSTRDSTWGRPLLLFAYRRRLRAHGQAHRPLAR